MKMLSQITNVAKKLKSYLLLEHRVPIYLERADYYRQRAIIESLRNGVLMDIDTTKGTDLIDITNTTALTLPTGKKIEFAMDRNGVYFARLEGGKYYPIAIEWSKNLLERSEEYEALSKSFWKRLLGAPKQYESEPYITAVHELWDENFLSSLEGRCLLSKLEARIENNQNPIKNLEKALES